MAQKYLLPCPCGKDIPVETSQAGENVVCSCGQTVVIPTMLKIKKLPLFDEAASHEKAASQKSAVSPGASGTPPAVIETSAATPPTAVRVHGPLMILGAILLFAFVFLTVYVVKFTYPEPQDVLNTREQYTFGNKTIYQNSTPIPYYEMVFLYYPEEFINFMTPDESMRYWRLLNEGPAMSLNFRENFQTLIYYYYLRCLGAVVLIGIALSIFITSVFVGNRTKTVATRKGTDWR